MFALGCGAKTWLLHEVDKHGNQKGLLICCYESEDKKGRVEFRSFKAPKGKPWTRMGRSVDTVSTLERAGKLAKHNFQKALKEGYLDVDADDYIRWTSQRGIKRLSRLNTCVQDELRILHENITGETPGKKSPVSLKQRVPVSVAMDNEGVTIQTGEVNSPAAPPKYQTEMPERIVRCIMNVGMEELFDEGVGYILESRLPDGMWEVYDKLGNLTRVAADRFELISGGDDDFDDYDWDEVKVGVDPGHPSGDRSIEQKIDTLLNGLNGDTQESKESAEIKREIKRIKRLAKETVEPDEDGEGDDDSDWRDDDSEDDIDDESEDDGSEDDWPF